MVQSTISRLEELITWDFIASEQHNQVRYGTLGNAYWKQFLPGGVVISPLHPPNRIPKPIYVHAKKIAKA